MFFFQCCLNPLSKFPHFVLHARAGVDLINMFCAMQNHLTLYAPDSWQVFWGVKVQRRALELGIECKWVDEIHPRIPECDSQILHFYSNTKIWYFSENLTFSDFRHPERVWLPDVHISDKTEIWILDPSLTRFRWSRLELLSENQTIKVRFSGKSDFRTSGLDIYCILKLPNL